MFSSKLLSTVKSSPYDNAENRMPQTNRDWHPSGFSSQKMRQAFFPKVLRRGQKQAIDFLQGLHHREMFANNQDTCSNRLGRFPPTFLHHEPKHSPFSSAKRSLGRGEGTFGVSNGLLFPGTRSRFVLWFLWQTFWNSSPKRQRGGRSGVDDPPEQYPVADAPGCCS